MKIDQFFIFINNNIIYYIFNLNNKLIGFNFNSFL